MTGDAGGIAEGHAFLSSEKLAVIVLALLGSSLSIDSEML
jgi:hypothetical protein